MNAKREEEISTVSLLKEKISEEVEKSKEKGEELVDKAAYFARKSAKVSAVQIRATLPPPPLPWGLDWRLREIATLPGVTIVFIDQFGSKLWIVTKTDDQDRDLRILSWISEFEFEVRFLDESRGYTVPSTAKAFV